MANLIRLQACLRSFAATASTRIYHGPRSVDSGSSSDMLVRAAASVGAFSDAFYCLSR